MLDIQPTPRGFMRADFIDRYNQKCSVQDSSMADEAAIWLGCSLDMQGRESSRMHLTQEMVRELLPALQRFVENGSIEP